MLQLLNPTGGLLFFRPHLPILLCHPGYGPVTLNTGLPTSAAVERLFSLDDLVFNSLCSRLSADTPQDDDVS